MTVRIVAEIQPGRGAEELLSPTTATADGILTQLLQQPTLIVGVTRRYLIKRLVFAEVLRQAWPRVFQMPQCQRLDVRWATVLPLIIAD